VGYKSIGDNICLFLFI